MSHYSVTLSELPPSVILLGAGVMVVSCAITSYANILMKIDAISLQDESHPRFIMARKLVLAAISLYILGGVADVFSLGLVPLSLRACASVLTIPFNAVFARIFLKESMSFVQIIGASITVFSCIVAMLFAANQETDDPNYLGDDDGILDKLLSHRMLLFTIWTLPLDIFCLSVVFRAVPRAGSHIAIVPFKSTAHRLLVLFSSTVAVSYQTGWTNLFIKCIAVVLKEEHPFAHADFWIFICITTCSAIAQMHLLSAMMRLFDAITCIPPYQILITIWLVAFSSVVFHEYPENVFGFGMSLGCSFLGILMVAIPPRESPSVPEFSENDQPLVSRYDRDIS
jgi:drug/metabolite transporter (DMT)-like permease